MPSIAHWRRLWFSLVREAGILPEDRHAVQAELTGKASTTQWTEADWDRACAAIQRDLGRHNDRHAHVRNDRPRGVAETPGEWATPAQVDYIQDLVERVRWRKGPTAYLLAHHIRKEVHPLRHGVMERHVRNGLAGKSLWQMLTRREASDFIKALESMARRDAVEAL